VIQLVSVVMKVGDPLLLLRIAIQSTLAFPTVARAFLANVVSTLVSVIRSIKQEPTCSFEQKCDPEITISSF